MVRVTVAEMSRQATKQLGLNVGGNWNVLTAAQFINPASSLVGLGTGVLAATAGASGGLNLQGQTNIGNSATVGGTLTALERAGVSRILAEPTLVAISGESATFTAGGEVPVPSSVVCSASAAGLQTGCVPSYTYKPYGVNLAFTPVVLDEGRISMRVSTEVTEIDETNGRQLQSGFNAPSFRVRKTATTIELPSGGVMMTAGLLSTQSRSSITGVPGLLNLPILGSLFRSRDFQRQETELVIMVTPYIAKPMDAPQAKRPDDGFVEAHDAETVLLGRLNKLYGRAGGSGPRSPRPALAARGPAPLQSGRVGFITD
jgi:pilus assembly protein CpaC